MKNFNKKFGRIEPAGMSIVPFLSISNKGKLVGLILSAIILLSESGCKKTVNSVEPVESTYGYGKLVVTCESKCHISFGVPDKMNVFDIDANTAIYYFRYQTKYNLDIFITPTDKDQTINMDVYSREEKQIFHNAAIKKLNEVWESKILVP
jgi:hypothetical protein